MKKTFQVGQKVIVSFKPENLETLNGNETEYLYDDFQNSWVSCMDAAVGQEGTVTHIHSEYGIYLEFNNPKIKDIEDFYFPPVCLVEVKETPIKELIQIIVNTKGLARRVTQKRDALGRFVKGANVGLLLAPGHVMGKHENAVVVHYGYNMFAQTVTSINPNTGRMHCKTFTNDGISKFSEHTVQVQPK